MTDDLVNQLWESDEASALTNRAARRIEELEAKLGKTTKLLEQIERRLSGISGFFFDTFPRKEIRSLLEELKGQGDE
jgi:uncharacterized alpha-E superfamily protein